jgi:hypothetical protein
MERLAKERVKSFVLGGNAIITIESGMTGKHFTYKITRSKTDANLYFVKSLRGADNLSDYVYIGCYYADTGYFCPEKRYKGTENYSWPKSLRAINYLFKRINDIPDNLYVYHEGRCCVCGRRLTTPESIELGVGPECAKYV